MLKEAGIKTIMVTGDHPKTANFIAQKVGIFSEKCLKGEDLDKLSDEELQEVVKKVSVFARTLPEHKFRLVQALHKNKEMVAVTGDGINDALALKEADVGIAMGIKGSDVAKEAADVVLADDNFITISYGIFEGRKLFDNLRKGVKYYLSAKLALILIFLLPAILNLPFPFAPIQIIVSELFMDLAASAGFVAEPTEKTIYKRLPRDSKEKFFDVKMLKEIFLSGFSLFLATMIPYFWALWHNLPLTQIQTFAFSSWLLGHIFLAFVCRSEKEPIFSLGFFKNKVMTLWAIFVFIFLVLVLRVPAISFYFKIFPLNISQFSLIFLISFLAIFWLELKKVLLFRKNIVP